MIFLVIIVIGVLLIIVIDIFLHLPKRKNLKQNSFTDFKNRILVELERCDLKECTLINEMPETTSMFGFPIASSELNHDPYKNQKNIVYLIYEHEGKKYLGGPIYKDLISTKLALIRKKTTFIYLSDRNSNDYYFDLKFIESQ